MHHRATMFADIVMPSTGIELPVRAHVPGTGTTPDWPSLEVAKYLVPERTCDNDWADNPAYLFGFELAQAGFFWEAHEVWEPVWLACPPNSRERLLLRALIQITNAELKGNMRRERAVLRLLGEARQELEELRPVANERLMGVDVFRLLGLLTARGAET